MFFLKIKVTPLFVVFMIPMLTCSVLVFFESTQLLQMVTSVIGYALLLTWIFSIFKILYKNEIISLKKYIWLVAVLLNSMFLMMTALLQTAGVLMFAGIYLVLLIQYGLCFLVYSIIEVSIGLRKYELERDPSFEEWFVQAVCFFFYPIGVWFIQPKLNKMVEPEILNKNIK